MAGPNPLSVDRSLRTLGEHVATWRKLQRLTTTLLSERAGINRSTLRAIETGRGTASTENLLRVLWVLGIVGHVVESADPYMTDLGKLRADEVLPRRVRG